MNKYMVLVIVSSCLTLRGEHSHETLKNHDPNHGYLVVLRYVEGSGRNAKQENPTVKVGPAKAKISNKPMTTVEKKGKPVPKQIDITPTSESHTYDGKGKLYAIGVYKEGVNRPSMVFYDRQDVDWPLYSHTVSTDKKNIVFDIYGPQSDGSFKVEWQP